MGLGFALALPRLLPKRKPAEVGAYIQCRLYDENKNFLGNQQAFVTPTGNAWEPYQLITDVSVKGYIQVVLGNATHTPVWFDDVKATAVRQVTQPVKSSSQRGTSTDLKEPPVQNKLMTCIKYTDTYYNTVTGEVLWVEVYTVCPDMPSGGGGGDTGGGSNTGGGGDTGGGGTGTSPAPCRACDYYSECSTCKRAQKTAFTAAVAKHNQALATASSDRRLAAGKLLAEIGACGVTATGLILRVSEAGLIVIVIPGVGEVVETGAVAIALLTGFGVFATCGGYATVVYLNDLSHIDNDIADAEAALAQSQADYLSNTVGCGDCPNP